MARVDRTDMTRNNRRTVVGVFADRSDAERAIQDLYRAGFTDDQIGMTTRDGEARGNAPEAQGDKGEEGAGTGVLAGAGIGGILGAVATGLIPGIGPVIAAGALAGILGGAAIGAAAGGLVGWLTGMGIPEEEAKYYESEFRAGRTLVTAQADGRYDEAAAIMRRNGGQTEARALGTERPLQQDEDQLELREEELRARKRTVDTGAVDVDKDVVTERETMDVPVAREEVDVEYHPTEPRAARGNVGDDDDEIHIPVHEEQVEAEKDTVVTGEVDVEKRRHQDVEEVSGEVRKERPRVRRKGDVDVEFHGEDLNEEQRP